MNENEKVAVKGESVGSAYLVLSARDLRKLLKKAIAGARAEGLSGRKAGNHCLVLRSSLVKFADDKDLQFSSADLEVHGGAI